MPKDRKGRSVSSDRSRASPYPCSSKGSLQAVPEPPLEDVKEWEEARCPVCMEHPHNAVLLLCSSHEKGCRPYMCDTSYRHSNCLDQFRKSFAENPSVMLLQEEISNSSPSRQTMRPEAGINLQEDSTMEGALNALEPVQAPCESQAQQKLVCPLCRGQINGWVVMESARRFMNSKGRSCACETCDYSGTYADLRKHARVEHPLVKPSVVDPERLDAWRMLERERDLGDVLSTMRSALLEERGADGIFEGASDSIFTSEEGSLLTVFFLFRVFRPGGSSVSGSSGTNSSSSRWSTFSRSRAQPGQSRSRGQSRIQRRTGTLWGENFETDNDSPAREEDHASSEREPDSRRRRRQQ